MENEKSLSVVPGAGAEKYLSYAVCLHYAILKEDSELLTYFLNLEIPKVKGVIYLDLNTIGILAKMDWSLSKQFFEKMDNLGQTLNENILTALSFVQDFSIANFDSFTVLELVIIIKYGFSRLADPPDGLTEGKLQLLYMFQRDRFFKLFSREIIPEIKSTMYLILATYDDIEAVQNFEDSILGYLIEHLSFTYDPIRVFKFLYYKYTSRFNKTLLKIFFNEALKNHAGQCLLFLISIIDFDLSDQLENAILYSNYIAFLAIPANKVKIKKLKDKLAFCYAPGIWQYYLKNFPNLQLPEMPEIVKRFL